MTSSENGTVFFRFNEFLANNKTHYIWSQNNGNCLFRSTHKKKLDGTNVGPTKNINNLNEHKINDFFFGVEIRMKMLEMFSTLFYVHVDGVCCYIIIFSTYFFWKFKYLMFDENIFICLKALSFRIFFHLILCLFGRKRVLKFLWHSIFAFSYT